MDAIELSYSADVSTPESAVAAVVTPVTLGRARVTVKDFDTNCDSNGVINPSIQRCTTFSAHKDTTRAVNDSGSASYGNFADPEISKNDAQLPSYQGKNVSELHYSRDKECLLSQPASVQLQRKAGKVSRSSNGSAKRPRIAHLEENITPPSENDDTPNRPVLYPTKCNFPASEKTQPVKQRNGFSGKRGERRNSKVSSKNRLDSVPMKGGSSGFTAAAGGNNFFGVHGLKSDSSDVTSQVEELSLNELLDGTFECPSSVKDKGNKTINMNENTMASIRKAFSILPVTRSFQSMNIVETGNSSNTKIQTFPPSSSSMVSSGVNGDEENPCTSDPPSLDKDSCSQPKTPANPHLEFPSYQPRDILERLALPPLKDLDSLLLDADKAIGFSKNSSDIRSGKQISRGASLPPFPWSHLSNGHCKTNSDAVKLLASRGACHGRWVKIGCSSSVLGAATDCFTNLELLTYDQSLVPVPAGGSKLRFFESKIGPVKSVGYSCCKPGLSSPAIDSNASRIHLGIDQGQLQSRVNDGHCPVVFTAAEILCDIKASCRGQIRNWSSSQKVAKARKLKSAHKAEEIYPATTSVSGHDNPSKRANHTTTFKRLKLLPTEDKKETNCVKKGAANMSAPRSSRPSPSKLARVSNTELRQQSHHMLPPRMLDRASNGHQKARKVLPLD